MQKLAKGRFTAFKANLGKVKHLCLDKVEPWCKTTALYDP